MRRYAGEMLRAVGRLSSLVDDLLEFVRVDETRWIRKATASRSPDRHLIHLDGDDGGGRKGCPGHVDLRRRGGSARFPHVERVLQNLLGNAVRHAPPGGMIRLEGRRNQSGVHLSVQDTGEGIPAEHVQHSSTRSISGPRCSGNVSVWGFVRRSTVRALGGTIEVSSQPSSGSRFDIRLPIAEMVEGPSLSRAPTPWPVRGLPEIQSLQARGRVGSGTRAGRSTLGLR